MLPGVNQPQTCPAGDRGRNAAIGQLQRSVLNLCLIGFDDAFVLLHRRGLSVQLLLGDGVFRFLIAFQVELRISQQRLILGKLPLCLRKRSFKRSRIDFDQQIAFVDVLPFGVGNFHELPVNACAHSHGVESRYEPKAVDVEIQVADPNGNGDDRNRPALA